MVPKRHGRRTSVHASTIIRSIGNPNAVPRWQWRCGFYPGSGPGECTVARRPALRPAIGIRGNLARVPSEAHRGRFSEIARRLGLDRAEISALRSGRAYAGMRPTPRRECELTGNKGLVSLRSENPAEAGTEDNPQGGSDAYSGLGDFCDRDDLSRASGGPDVRSSVSGFACTCTQAWKAAITNAPIRRCLSATRRHRAAPPSASSIPISRARESPRVIGGIAASIKE